MANRNEIRASICVDCTTPSEKINSPFAWLGETFCASFRTMPMGDSILEKLHTIFGGVKVLTREGLNLRVACSVTLLAEAHRNENEHK